MELRSTALALGFIAGSLLVAQSSAHADGLAIVQTSSVPVTLIVGSNTKYVQTSANDIGAVLEEQGITLGKNDVVYPSLADRVTPHQTIHVTRVTRWVQTERQSFAPQTIQRLVFSLPSGKLQILSHGNNGTREVLVRYEQRDSGRITSLVVGQNVLRKAQPRIVAIGTSEFDAFVQRGLDKTAYVASRTLRMVATAYTAGCAGCSGITASGRRAGHGIVAVDPHYIPLGTHLYIPGYGVAIAGDTGSAIRGNRIDLGFNSNWDALQFGRRSIVVYQLK